MAVKKDNDERYRLNVHINLALGERLHAYCEENDLTKLHVVTKALEDYFLQVEIRQELAEKMKDPVVMAEMAQRFGLGVPGGTK